eukprot:s5067_g5.t1
MIVMGSQMDGNLLKAAAEAHHKAIGSIDSKGVTSPADYEAVNAALGRVVASVPKATVMDVYNSLAGVVDASVQNNMFSKVNPLDAMARMWCRLLSDEESSARSFHWQILVLDFSRAFMIFIKALRFLSV